MKNTAKHTPKSTKGERLGWAPVTATQEVRSTAALVRSRDVTAAVRANECPDATSQLLVP